MIATNKDIDKYFLNRFNIYQKEYNNAFIWACKNWHKMLPRAQGKNAVSVADQIAEACKIPYSASADIANSISISRSITK